MKRVAIVTFLSENYGTCLQAFALKKAIERLGCTADILNINRQAKTTKLYIIQRIKSLFTNFPYVLPTDIPNWIKATRRKSQNFAQFREGYLKPTKSVVHTVEDLLNLESSYDLFISGSDMVWSTEYIKYAKIYFLSGIPYEKSGSYAPSFGSTLLNEREREQYANFLHSIKFLSCREIGGINLIEELTGRKAFWTIDPTLLFSAEEWLEFLQIDKDRNSKDYICVNCFGQLPKSYRFQMRELKKLTDSSAVRYLNSGCRDMKADMKYGSADYGPKEFVELIKNCNLSLVNGYHGLLFSLIFEKPFLLYHREEKEHWCKHEDRMMDLVKYLGIEDRYLYYRDRINHDFLKMDYSIVNKKLADLRKRSWDYLKEMISSIN